MLYDVPGHRELDHLGRGEPVDAAELEEIEAATGVAAGDGDVALIRTGYMRHWPDAERWPSTAARAQTCPPRGCWPIAA